MSSPSVLDILKILSLRKLKEMASFGAKSASAQVLPLAAGAELSSTIIQAEPTSPQELKEKSPNETKNKKVATLKIVRESEEHSSPQDRFPLELPKENESEENVHSKDSQNQSLESVGILSAAKVQKQEEQKKLKKLKETPSETEFILNERAKAKMLEHNQHHKEGLSEYKKSSTLRLYQVTIIDEQGQEKVRLTSTQGVLVNRSQE
jgi:hypothetical protein